MPADLQPAYNALCKLLKKHAKGFIQTDRWEPSTAKEKKPTLLLLCKNKVSVMGRPPQNMMLAAGILQKNYVSLHFMPIYAVPKEFKLSPRLKKLLKGKACFQIKSIDPDLNKELDALLAQGIKCFKKLGWI